MSDTIIEKYGKKIMLLTEAIENGKLPDAKAADLWVINHTDEILVSSFLHKMIRSNDLSIYLKPIYLQKEFKSSYKTKELRLKYLTDGYVTALDFADKVPFIEEISTFVAKYKAKRKSNDYQTNEFLFLKTFDYFYTRKKTINPTLNRNSLAGYSYRRIEAYFYHNRDAFFTSRMLLQEAYQKGWLSRQYKDTSHLCHNCSSGFLNYRESCPKCGQHNLQATAIIHHFRCAYVGTEKDFIVNDKLICPKCSAALKNLGVDYDKPGKTYRCKNTTCSHTFQEAPVEVCCVDCETEQAPDQLIVKKIYKYNITSLGIEKGLF